MTLQKVNRALPVSAAGPGMLKIRGGNPPLFAVFCAYIQYFIISAGRISVNAAGSERGKSLVGVTMMCDKELLNMKTCKQFFIFQK